MRLLPRLWVFALLVFFIGGCTQVTTPPETVEVRLGVKDWLDRVPLAGAKICQTETDPPNCVMSGPNGIATLELPTNQRLSYAVEKKGYGSLLFPIVTGRDGTSEAFDANMKSNEWLTDNFDNLESPYPQRDTGAIRIVIAPRLAGATLELLDATGEAYYKDEEENWSPLLKATTDGEGCCAVGGFVEVGQGEFQVEIGGTGKHCVLATYGGGTVRGWPGDAPNRIRVPVREGFFTRAVASCPTPL
jgi:hypothetical protein